MARQYGHEKVPLVECLSLLSGSEPLSYSRFGDLLMAKYGASRRACKDAIGVLHAGGYIDSVPAPDDGRGKLFSVTDRGRQVVAHPAGATILRYARKLFTTCASRPTLQLRVARARGLEPREALLRVEALILTGAYKERIAELAETKSASGT